MYVGTYTHSSYSSGMLKRKKKKRTLNFYYVPITFLEHPGVKHDNSTKEHIYKVPPGLLHM